MESCLGFGRWRCLGGRRRRLELLVGNDGCFYCGLRHEGSLVCGWLGALGVCLSPGMRMKSKLRDLAFCLSLLCAIVFRSRHLMIVDRDERHPSRIVKGGRGCSEAGSHTACSLHDPPPNLNKSGSMATVWRCLRRIIMRLPSMTVRCPVRRKSWRYPDDQGTHPLDELSEQFQAQNIKGRCHSPTSQDRTQQTPTVGQNPNLLYKRGVVSMGERCRLRSAWDQGWPGGGQERGCHDGTEMPSHLTIQQRGPAQPKSGTPR